MSALGTAGANHHTQKRRIKRTEEQRENWADRVRVGKLMQMLEECAQGRVQLEGSQIKSIEVYLDRTLPRLSAVEQTEVNELDTLSREDILARIQLLLKSDPSLLPELVALQAREAAQQPVESLPKRNVA